MVQAGQMMAGANPDELQHRKLTDAAQQFEAMFLQQMMKPFSADKEDDSDSGDKDDDVGGAGTYQSMGVESMAKAISAAGGLGIARSVVASVERQAHGNLSREEK
jgi:flagellar protein FlgJ